jgi:hypothetical protein
MSKKVTMKATNKLALKAAATIKAEVAPILAACKALSKKYTALSKAEAKSATAAAKASLPDLREAHIGLQYAYEDVAHSFNCRAGTRGDSPVAPDLFDLLSLDWGHFADMDKLAALPETAEAAPVKAKAKPKPKAAPVKAKPKAAPVKAGRGATVVTGGAPLSYSQPASKSKPKKGGK